MRPINHQEAYSLDGACTNWEEAAATPPGATASYTLTF
jgi:hypothetical protein